MARERQIIENQQVFQNRLDAVAPQMDRVREQIYAPVRNLIEDQGRQLAVQLARLEQEDRQNIQIQQNQLAELRVQNERIRRETEVLQAANVGVRDRSSQAERQVNQLNDRLNKVQQVIDERKEAAQEKMLQTFLIIGACAFLSWALPPLAGGATPFAHPDPIRNGIKFGATFRF